MIGFLNERSLEEHCDWEAALILFLQLSYDLKPAQVRLFRDSSFFFQGEFKARFNALGFPKDLRGVVRDLVFSNRYFGCWRPVRVSDADHEFSCVNPLLNLRDDSICEAAERQGKKEGAPVLLVSAADSLFGDQDRVQVRREGWDNPAELQNFSSLTTAKTWIAQGREMYDPESALSSPRDFQTILEKSPERFRRTGKVERRSSRRIFEETATGHLLYVDDAHLGYEAHLEVFSADGIHLGVASVDTGALDATRIVAGRRLRL